MIAGSAVLVKRDLDAQKGRMARMEIGAKLAGLKVRLQVRRNRIGWLIDRSIDWLIVARTVMV